MKLINFSTITIILMMICIISVEAECGRSFTVREAVMEVELPESSANPPNWKQYSKDDKKDKKKDKKKDDDKKKKDKDKKKDDKKKKEEPKKKDKYRLTQTTNKVSIPVPVIVISYHCCGVTHFFFSYKHSSQLLHKQ
jgi:hypothetical protein